MGPEFEETIKWFRSLLNFEGFWLDKNGEYNLNRMMRVLCVTIILAFVSALTNYILRHDLGDFISKMAPTIALILASCKMINFMIHRKLHVQLLNKMKHDFWTGDETEIKIVKNTTKLVRHLFFFFMSMVYETAGSFCITPMLENIFINREKHPEFQRRLPFDLYIPSFINIDQRESPAYEIFYAMQTVAVLICAINIGVFDNVFANYALHICAQLQIIQRRLKAITNHVKENEYNEFSIRYGIIKNEEMDDDDDLMIEDKNMFNHLRQCIQHHQLLLDMAVKLEEIYTFELFAQCFNVIIVLCTSLFHLANKNATLISKYFSATSVIFGMVQLFIYTYISNELTTEFDELGMACYSCKWYHCNQHIKKSLLIIIGRTQKPTYLTVGKIGISNLNLFASVVQTAASYFTILKSFED